MKSRDKKAIFIALIILTVMITVCGGLGTIHFAIHHRRMNAFDQEIWKSQHESTEGDNPRWNMRHAVRERFLRRGMTQQAVIDLLGEPDWSKSPQKYSYTLGAWSGFRIDYDSLDVYFDNDGKLVKTAVVQH